MNLPVIAPWRFERPGRLTDGGANRPDTIVNPGHTVDEVVEDHRRDHLPRIRLPAVGVVPVGDIGIRFIGVAIAAR